MKKGVCSFAQKAEFASHHIHPIGKVKFLIIDGEIRMDQQNDHDNFQRVLARETYEKAELSIYENPKYYDYYNYSNTVVTFRRKHANDINVALLHVSYETGQELQSLVLNEYPTVKKHGGIRVTIDSTAPPISQGIIMIWTALCVVLSFLACCCLANYMDDMYEIHQPEPEPPRRPRRPKLTPEQVEKMPIGIFDGSQLVYNDEECPCVETEQEGDIEQNRCLQPAEGSLDACTICLDEYEVGDKVRCLPCGHAFHANCIARWLIERHATCPLCNHSMVEEESDDEEDEDDDGPIDPPGTVLADPPTTIEEETSIRDPWWRYIFPRRERRAEIGEGLTEPLLQEQPEDLEEARPVTESVDEETPLAEEPQASEEAAVSEEPEVIAHDTQDEEAPAQTQEEETLDEPNSSD